VEEDEAARLLGENPVNPSEAGFAVMAEKLIRIIESEAVCKNLWVIMYILYKVYLFQQLVGGQIYPREWVRK